MAHHVISRALLWTATATVLGAGLAGGAQGAPELNPPPRYEVPLVQAPWVTGRMTVPMPVIADAPTRPFNPELRQALADKNYAFVLKFYTAACQTKTVGSFAETEAAAKADKGAAACYFLGEMHREGLGVPMDVNAALADYRIAADGGFWPAVTTLARMHFRGDGVATDVAGGIDRIAGYTTDPRNSRQGMCNGAEFLADLYARGRYVAQSGAGAEKWYLYCLDHSEGRTPKVPNAYVVHDMRLLADLYGDESLMPGHAADAAQIYVSILGFTDSNRYEADGKAAQRGLGEMYIAGRGVGKDVAKGVDLLKASISKSAKDQKSAMALYGLYNTGEVVPADPAQAEGYFDHAVQANWPEAQTMAALTVLNASPPEPDKAKALLMAAAVTGYVPAQYELGRYYLEYSTGTSGPLTAYLWFDLAAQNDRADAAKARDDLAAKLSPDDLQQVRTAEAQLKAKYAAIVAY